MHVCTIAMQICMLIMIVLHELILSMLVTSYPIIIKHNNYHTCEAYQLLTVNHNGIKWTLWVNIATLMANSSIRTCDLQIINHSDDK